MKSILLFSFFLLFNLFFSNAQAVKFPLQEGCVNDFEGLFTIQQQKELSTLLEEFKAKTDREIAVITLDDIQPYSNVSDYTKELSYNWSLTKEEIRNGLLVIVSKSLKTVRITTAYGTHQLIQQDICKRIINNEMIPAYSIGNYFDGTKKGVISLMRQWN